jgi:hypothetical protein
VSTTIKTIVEEVTNPQSTQRLIARTDILGFGQECYFEAFCIIVSHLLTGITHAKGRNTDLSFG